MTAAPSLAGRLRAEPLAPAALAVAAVSALTLAGAWYFELVLELAPCPLCLEQRLPYYAAVPLGILVGLAARAGHLGIARLGLLLLAAAMLVGAGYGAYHAGIEWGFWEGPAACSAAAPGAPMGDILSSLKAAKRVVPCNEAAWRFLGLSLAGYNVLIAGGLAALALCAALARTAKNA